MLSTWMLSEFYLDPLHGWRVPVCSAYGENYIFPPRDPDSDAWTLVYIDTSPQQIEAAKQDPRVVVCGSAYNTPPPQLLQAYADKLDPNTNYVFLGQVLSKLSEIEPGFSIGS